MTEKHNRPHRHLYSLRVKLLFVILIGTVIAASIYVLGRATANTVISTQYATPTAKAERERAYIMNLQKYIDQNGLASQDSAQISRWAQRNRYVYMLLYKDSELVFSSDSILDPDNDSGFDGLTVDYPKRDQLMQYAKENDYHTLRIADGVLLASVVDYTEYLYYDVANVLSLVAAAAALAIVMMLYFYDLTRRITHLADDVTVVSDGDMHHQVVSTGRDEIAVLSTNVEQMRLSLLENIRKEREAMDANTELITSMSHDIRTPLTVLLGYIDIMKLHASDGVMQSYLNASEKTALRLKELSDDMFRYFLVFGNKELEVDIQDYDAATLLEQLLSDHIQLLRENGYAMTANAVGRVSGCVRTDAPKLARIIDNLFSNLRKYADPDAGISLTVEEEAEVLQLRFTNAIRRSGEEAESNGIGLRTCQRIAEAIGISFTCGEQGDSYHTELRLPLSPATQDSTPA